MTHIKDDIKQMSMTYMIKGHTFETLQVKPDGGNHFFECSREEVDIKWLVLSSNIKGTAIHKLMLHNTAEMPLSLQVRIHYKAMDRKSVPFVYYSPHNEAMMVCEERAYILAGGMGPGGGAVQYQTNARDVMASCDSENAQAVFQPLSPDSSEWAMVYDVSLRPFGKAHLYDWHVRHECLRELELIHDSLQGLFRKRSAVKV